MLCGSHEGMQEGLLLPKQTPGNQKNSRNACRKGHVLLKSIPEGCNLLFPFSPISWKGGQSMDPGGGSIAGGPAAAALPHF